MQVEDYFANGKRWWVRLQEKGGKRHEMSAHHKLDAYEMVRRRTADAGFNGKLGCHVFRATGITAYLEAGGTLENAQAMAAHETPRTTKLYDRTADEITLDEVERITI
jgi:integrase/recombinase XerD